MYTSENPHFNTIDKIILGLIGFSMLFIILKAFLDYVDGYGPFDGDGKEWLKKLKIASVDDHRNHLPDNYAEGAYTYLIKITSTRLIVKVLISMTTTQQNRLIMFTNENTN